MRQYILGYSKEKNLFELSLVENGKLVGGTSFMLKDLMIPIGEGKEYFDLTWLKEMSSKEICNSIRALL